MTSGERASPTPALIALDLLRGLAALAVFLGHIRGGSFVEFGSLPIEQQTVAVAIMFGLARLGREAVLLFFVLSGFLVGGQIITRIQHGGFDLRDYAADRATRILVPLIPACLGTALINHFVLGEPVSLADLAGNMIGLNGVAVATLNHNIPLWSLAYEIWFYVLGGAIGCILATRRLLPASLLITLILCVVIFSILSPRYLMYWIFAGSMVLFLEMKHRKLIGIVGFTVVLLAVCLSQLAVESRSFHSVVIVRLEVAETLLVAGLCLMLPMLCSRSFNDALFWLRTPSVFIANISYSLYLVHSPVNSAMDLMLPQADAITPVSIGMFLSRIFICLGVAIGFYYLFERRSYVIRRYLKSKRRGEHRQFDRAAA